MTHDALEVETFAKVEKPELLHSVDFNLSKLPDESFSLWQGSDLQDDVSHLQELLVDPCYKKPSMKTDQIIYRVIKEFDSEEMDSFVDAPMKNKLYLRFIHDIVAFSLNLEYGLYSSYEASLIKSVYYKIQNKIRSCSIFMMTANEVMRQFRLLEIELINGSTGNKTIKTELRSNMRLHSYYSKLTEEDLVKNFSLVNEEFKRTLGLQLHIIGDKYKMLGMTRTVDDLISKLDVQLLLELDKNG